MAPILVFHIHVQKLAKRGNFYSSCSKSSKYCSVLPSGLVSQRIRVLTGIGQIAETIHILSVKRLTCEQYTECDSVSHAECQNKSQYTHRNTQPTHIHYSQIHIVYVNKKEGYHYCMVKLSVNPYSRTKVDFTK